MIELLNIVDEPGVIECSSILKGKEVLASSFPEQYKNHATIAKQSFNYIFATTVKMKSKHDEAHLEIGDKRLSGFILKGDLILVCLSFKDSNIQQVRKQARQAHAKLLKDELQEMSKF